MSKEALKLALYALEFIPESGSMLGAYAEEKRVNAITAIKQALEQPVQEPVAWCSQCGHVCPQTINQEPIGWWDAKLGFFEEKHFDQLQPLYTIPPAQEFICSTGLCHYKPAAPVQEPVAMRMPKVGDKVVCIEDESLGTVVYLTAGGSPEIKFDDGSHGTYMLREFAELFGYTTPAAQPATEKSSAVQQEPAQEPVAWMSEYGLVRSKQYMSFRPTTHEKLTVNIPLYTTPPTPPAQEFVCSTGLCHYRKPLTGEEMNQIEARWEASIHGSKIAFVVRETEAAHGIKEKNT